MPKRPASPVVTLSGAPSFHGGRGRKNQVMGNSTPGEGHQLVGVEVANEPAAN